MEDLVIEERERAMPTATTHTASRNATPGLPLALRLLQGCRGSVRPRLRQDLRPSTVVFGQSCIYGPRQFGIEDQGWVAWFIIATQLNRPITIYGDGKQVRDVLYVEDLLDAYDAAIARATEAPGEIYNIGGGPDNQLSVWHEFAPLLEELRGSPIPVARGPWRPGDQRIFVADIRKAHRDLGWTPKVDVRSGIGKLYEWVRENQSLLTTHLGCKLTVDSSPGGQSAAR